jgi:hypothetical protein
VQDTTGADRFTTPTNAHGVVLLQYLDSTGGVITTFESPYFTNNTAAGVWSNLCVAGKAPLGTVSGRTLLAILGTNTGFSGSLWFDDVSLVPVLEGAVPPTVTPEAAAEVTVDTFFPLGAGTSHGKRASAHISVMGTRPPTGVAAGSPAMAIWGVAQSKATKPARKEAPDARSCASALPFE